MLALALTRGFLMNRKRETLDHARFSANARFFDKSQARDATMLALALTRGFLMNRKRSSKNLVSIAFLGRKRHFLFVVYACIFGRDREVGFVVSYILLAKSRFGIV